MIKKALRVDSLSSSFGELVKKVSGINVDLCFQCGKCASGCPISFAMDYTPTQLLHAIQLGLRDEVLNSRTIWLCSSCQTCTTRCPQDVDLAEVMDTVRIIAQRQKTVPSVPGVPAFYRNSVSNIRIFGRTYELGLMASLKLSTRNFSQDMRLGMKMLRKGKFSIFPSFRGSGDAREIIRRVKAMEDR